MHNTETIIRNNQEAEIAWHYDHNILWPAGLFLAVTGNFKIHETASQHRAGVFWWEMIDSSLVPGSGLLQFTVDKVAHLTQLVVNSSPLIGLMV